MLGTVAKQALGRVVHDAMESVSRRVIWLSLATVLALIGSIFALIVAFWLIERQVGPIWAGLAVAALCFIAAAICAAVPAIGDRQQEAQAALDPAPSAAAVVREEAKEAVDYFGPLRLMITAFMFGFTTARRFRR